MSDPIPLSRSTLHQLPPTIARPRYDPASVKAGIVHIGTGAFHRAHMARYTHDLMQSHPHTPDWGIIGVGLLPVDLQAREVLKPQDYLYTLIERQDDTEVATVIGALREVLFAGDGPTAALSTIASPSIHVVSLTVTESGYCLDTGTKRLDPNHPAIVQDLAHPALPQSAIGLLVDGYRRRRAASLPAFTTLSCDNIQHNGKILRAAVLALAELQEPGLAEWIDAHARFPSSMVDRITPGTTQDDIDHIRTSYGVDDRWPISSEVFRQWVIEDQFATDRPGWDAVGAQFVSDVTPYEYMKLRLLNASHLAIAAVGQLAGHVHVDSTMRDPLFPAYMQILMDCETGPTVPLLPDVDLSRYKANLLARFANPHIKDTLQRINTGAPINLLLDPIRDRLERGEESPLLALALAAWIRRLSGVDDAGGELTIIHPQADELKDYARRGGADPRPVLAVRALFGDLVENKAFVATVAESLASLCSKGARGTLKEILSAR